MTIETSDTTFVTSPGTTPTQITHHLFDSHFVQIVNVRLNGNNFTRWSLSVCMYICRQGKTGYLTGKEAALAKTNLTYASWDAKNSTIMAWPVSSMDEDIGCYCMW